MRMSDREEILLELLEGRVDSLTNRVESCFTDNGQWVMVNDITSLTTELVTGFQGSRAVNFRWKPAHKVIINGMTYVDKRITTMPPEGTLVYIEIMTAPALHVAERVTRHDVDHPASSLINIAISRGICHATANSATEFCKARIAINAAG